MQYAPHQPMPETCQPLEAALMTNRPLWHVITTLRALDLPGCYIGGGCVAQSFWNRLWGLDPLYGIDDFDLVYFDGGDLSPGGEEMARRRAEHRFGPLPVGLDVVNEARVHLWYGAEFGKEIPPFASTEHAIACWPSTATSVGVCHDGGRLLIHAPFGLGDLYGGVIRPNKALIDRDIYEAKAGKWHKKWPRTIVTPWDEEGI